MKQIYPLCNNDSLDNDLATWLNPHKNLLYCNHGAMVRIEDHEAVMFIGDTCFELAFGPNDDKDVNKVLTTFWQTRQEEIKESVKTIYRDLRKTLQKGLHIIDSVLEDKCSERDIKSLSRWIECDTLRFTFDKGSDESSDKGSESSND